MPERIFLIDGHALIFKMYYAFLRRPMINSKGVDTSILFGFTKYLLELVSREHPTHLAVSFDPPGGTFRNEMYPEYKANRAATPQLVIDALEPLQEICKALDIPVYMVMGYEADDVIGTIATKCGQTGAEVYMVTPDKDYGQLINDHVWQLKPGKSGGDDELVGVKEVCEKYGIATPKQVIEMLTICGDSADNVPGVRGVGEVGAAKLIGKYGSVDNIYGHIDELTPRQQAQFIEAKDHIALSHDLVTIRTDVPVDFNIDEMALDLVLSQKANDIFEEFEFNSLKRHLRPSTESVIRKASDNHLDFRQATPDEVMSLAKAARECALITEGLEPGIFTEVRNITIAAPDGAGYAVAECDCEQVRELLEDPGIAKYGYNLKLQCNILVYNGIELRGRLLDIELLHYLINPEKSHKLETLAKSLLGIDLETDEAAVEEDVQISLFDMPADNAVAGHRFKEAAASLAVGHKVMEEAVNAGAIGLYDDMEEPLGQVLAKMERNGVKVDPHQLGLFADDLRREAAGLEKEIREMVDEPGLNVSSPKQVGDVLFGKLKLDSKARKSARGSYPTDENTLSEIADKHPVVDKILDFRGLRKLLSTYIEPFPSFISPVDSKIHTTFNQALTATGRLSSSNPNLQNIPVRTERGKEIRKAFISERPDGLIVSADYSQIELRIMAHLSGDEHLIRAFREGQDVHAATAAKIFGIPVEDVTADQRRTAKTANFGIMYGISAFGLSQRLKISRTEAKKLIDDYFAAFPSIRTFINETVSEAEKNGYVSTIFGRKRWLPEINAKNATVRALAERNAVNAPIQGTAADIIKLAMIRVDCKMAEAGLKSRMVLQIHDELVFDAAPDEVEALSKLAVAEMENTVELSVPLTVECNYGKNWLEAH